MTEHETFIEYIILLAVHKLLSKRLYRNQLYLGVWKNMHYNVKVIKNYSKSFYISLFTSFQLYTR